MYSKPNRGGYAFPVCHDLVLPRTEWPVAESALNTIIPKSIRCGEETWASIGPAGDGVETRFNSAGSVDLNIFKNDGPIGTDMVIKVGAYDVKKMPAVLLFGDENCQEGSSRYFLHPELSDGSEYDQTDLTRQN